MPHSTTRAPTSLVLCALCLIGLAGSCSVRNDGLRLKDLEGSPAGGGPREGRRPATLPPSDAGPGLITEGTPDAQPAPGQTDPESPPGAQRPPDAAAGIDAPATEGGVALAALGQACRQGAECGSGFCADGVCCASACAGICEFCALPDSAGQCLPVLGAPRGERPACMGARPPCAGSCDGRDRARCQYPGAETECVPPTCQDDIARTRGTCLGTGACSRRLEIPCGGMQCAGTLCAGPCDPQRPCAPNRYCAAGLCFPKLPSGQPCAHPEQCQSGTCLDGFCCQQEACGLCEGCTGPGGTCLRLPAGPDPDSCTDGQRCTPDGACR